MSTSNVSHDIALIHYGWKDFIPEVNDLAERRLVREGLTYVSFTRTKNIGNILNLTFTGKLPDLYVGDWLVLKTTSSGRFSEDENSSEFYLKKGLVRFIGQIYNVNSQYNVDADGILRKTFNISVREWSHCLNIPVRYSDQIRLLSLNQESQTKELKKIISQETAKIQNPQIRKFVDSNWKEYLSTRKPAFEIIKNILTMIGVRSYALSERKEQSWIYLTTSQLPSIPAQIYEDHIFKYQEEKYEEDFPFNTGFMETLVGPQKWGPDTQLMTYDFFSPLAIFDIVNKNANRPVTFISPAEYSKGDPFPELVKSILDSGGEYEIYSDMLYIANSNNSSSTNLCKPVFIVRDKPISFKTLQNSNDIKEYKESEKDFGFTYKDDVPRITIPLNHVLSLYVSYTSQETFNYLQFNPKAKAFIETYAQSVAYREGRYKDVQSQKRFGGQEYFASIGEFISAPKEEPAEAPPTLKRTEKKDKQNPKTKVGSEPEAKKNGALSVDWFKALTQKYRYYMPIKHAMPNVNVQIIDKDFPLTVGLMVRIELGENRPTICGEIQEISYTTNINGEGKISNQTYVKLIDLLMENPENPSELIIIPKQFSQTLFIDTTQYNAENDSFLNIKREN